MAGKYEFAYNVDGSNSVPAIHEFPIAASQTLLVGDLVIVSSNQVAIAGASCAEVLGVMAEAVTTPAAGTMVRVYVANSNQVWKTTADADASSVVLGTKTMDINATTQTVDVADTANGCLQVIKTGDANTDVYVNFNATRFGS